MLKHTRNTNNSGIRFYKQIYKLQLQKCWTRKNCKNAGLAKTAKMLDSQNRLQKYFKNAKTSKFLSELAFYTSEGHTCKVLSFYDFWFMVNDKFCSPYPIVGFYANLITKIGNRNLNASLDTSRVLTIFLWHENMILYNCKVCTKF